MWQKFSEPFCHKYRNNKLSLNLFLPVSSSLTNVTMLHSRMQIKLKKHDIASANDEPVQKASYWHHPLTERLCVDHISTSIRIRL